MRHWVTKYWTNERRTLQCLSEFEQIHLSLTLKGVTKLSLTKFEKLEMRPHLFFFSRSAHIKNQDTEIVLFSKENQAVTHKNLQFCWGF